MYIYISDRNSVGQNSQFFTHVNFASRAILLKFFELSELILETHLLFFVGLI